MSIINFKSKRFRGIASSAVASRTAITLGSLSLSGALIAGTSSSGTITGATTGSTITTTLTGLTINSSARTYSFDGSAAAGASGGLVETLDGAAGSPKTTALTVNASAPSLSALALSGSLVHGTSSSGSITGATSGSTITTTIAGLTINSAARTYSFDGSANSGAAGGLVETLSGASNSPRTTAISVGAATLGTLALSGNLVNGVASSGSITGATLGSTITSTLTGLTVNSSARTYSFDGSAAAGASGGLVETLSGATGSPKTTAMTVAAGVQPITVVSNNNSHNVSTYAVSSGYNNLLYRVPAALGGPVTALKVLVPTFQGVNGAKAAVAVNFQKMALEYNGVTVPLTFGGNRALTYNSASADVIESDEIPATAFGVAFIPADAVVYRRFGLIQTAGDAVPYGLNSSATGAAGYISPAYSDQVDNAGSLTAPSGSLGVGQCPSVILAGRFKDKAYDVWAGIGDSETWGYSDSNSGGTGQSGTAPIQGPGWFRRAMLSVVGAANAIASLNLAIPGETGANFLGSGGAKRLSMLSYVTAGNKGRATEFYGTNDIATAGTVTASTVTTMLTNLWAALRTANIKTIVRVQLYPRTANTPTADSYASLANQTEYPGWTSGGVADQVNTFTAGSSSVDYVLTTRDIAGDASVPTKWKANGSANYATADGTHPLSWVHIALAEKFRKILIAIAGVIDPLQPLALSNPLVTGASSSGTITGAEAGSTITTTVNGLTINSAARTYTFSGAAGAGAAGNLVETLAGAAGSPKTTAITVQNAASLSALSLSGSLRQGTASSGTISGATAGSTITTTVAGLTINSSARTYSFDGTATAGAAGNLVETLSGASASPRSTAVTVLPPAFILASGAWSDAGIWDDTAVWKDAA